ncbi:Sensitive to high expression protein 9, mitochondrial [Nakaseomyces bracarensis]|uniref:Sensitive to high expression protein 9, mitochondrial n=1 Tax=Nakaseomyces bracarensis TaxID=273131 RepID=A0ABR4NTW2_9SACH
MFRRHLLVSSLAVKPSHILLFKGTSFRYISTTIKLLQDKKIKHQPNQSIASNFYHQYDKTVDMLKKTWEQLVNGKKVYKHHASQIKSSLQEANRKFAEQEDECNDSRLNYKKDELTSRKIEGLPSERELHRKKWSRKLEFYIDSLQETLFTATRALNDVTGYSSIQRLKNSIAIMEEKLSNAKKERSVLKEQYTKAIETRTTSQKKLNELLQRKSTWSPKDLETFTELYKNDAMNIQNEKNLKEKVKNVEAEEEQITDNLYRAILTRYHEEQIWSDKIRRTSTWGTFILMGFNLVLFLIFQLLLEPWKRRRLTGSFEGKVISALEKYSDEQEIKFKNLVEEVKQSNLLTEEVLQKENSKDKLVFSFKNFWGKLKNTILNSSQIYDYQFNVIEISLSSIGSLLLGLLFSYLI